VFTFLTGEGGFLQEFLYGYTGLRWQGRVFDVTLGPSTSTLTLRSGFEPAAGDAVRLQLPATRFGGQNPKLAELAVRG
jgi:hypothetical protein